MASGRVKFFSVDKGFGFIVPDGGGPDVFVHIIELRKSGMDRLNADQPVSYEVTPGRDGKGPKAVQIASLR